MEDKTIQLLDTVIDRNSHLVNRINNNFDKGDYPGVIEDIVEMGKNTEELEHICYNDNYTECKDYVFNKNIPLHLEVIQKLKDKCE